MVALDGFHSTAAAGGGADTLAERPVPAMPIASSSSTFVRPQQHHQQQQQESAVLEHPPFLSKSNTTTTTAAATTTYSRSIVPVERGDFILKGGSQWGSNMAPVVVEEYKLIFFTIQKTGCTVWKQLFRRMMGYDNWRTGKTWPPGTNGLNYLWMYKDDQHQTQATALMNDPTYTRAIFVRDPKERFVSAFLDKAVHTDYFVRECCKGKKNPQKYEACRRLENPHQTNNHTNTDTTDTNTDTNPFAFFVQKTRTCLDSHWTPQSRRMEDKYYPLLDFVGHLETAAADAERLLKRIGAWEDHGTSGWGAYGNESIFQSTSHVKHKTTGGANGNQEDSSSYARLAKYLTPETEAELEERFAKDYTIPQYNLPLKKVRYSTT
jgi:hypothetical protein